MNDTKKEIPRSMIQLAHENGAELDIFISSTGKWRAPIMETDILVDDVYYRIANKTADGLRLDELLEQADWDISNILEAGDFITGYDSIDDYIYHTCKQPNYIADICLVKKESYMRDMTAQEVAMLPRGTAFVHITGNTYYNPTVSAYNWGLEIDWCNINEFSGYILPNETELREFKVEDKNE